MDGLIAITHRVNPVFSRRASAPVVSGNERAILDLIRRRPGLTRADITQATGLTAQSISRLVDALAEREFVKIGSRLVRGRGQPSTTLQLNADAAFCLGVSIMTDALSLTLLDLSGDVRAERMLKPRTMTVPAILKALHGAVDGMISETGTSRERLFGAGFAVSGFFVGEGRRVNPPEALEALAFVDLEEAFASGLGLPISLENDGTAAAIGESLHGAGRWAQSFAYLYFANGFGGGIIAEGLPLRGQHGNAGEFSNILEPGRHERPTLELLREEFDRDDIAYSSLAEMLAQHDTDHPAVARWIERVTPSLQVICSAISAVNDPDAIVFGGRIPKHLASRVIEGIRLHNSDRRARPKPEPRLCASETSGDAASIGAASLLFKRHFFR